VTVTTAGVGWSYSPRRILVLSRIYREMGCAWHRTRIGKAVVVNPARKVAVTAKLLLKRPLPCLRQVPGAQPIALSAPC
jgi:hypothetical protein